MLIDRLIDRIRVLRAPIVVGLDPTTAQIPESLQKQYGPTTEGAAALFAAFNRVIIDHVCDLVPAVKPQIAMYEQLGPAGLAAYQQTVDYAKAKGLLVIGDVKRGDIASTAKAYSDAHLGRTVIGGTAHAIFDTDFITVNPYMGDDAITPYLADCRAYNKGLFVLVKTSNPLSGRIQNLITADGRPVYEHVGEAVVEWGADFVGTHGFSAVGAVVGATHKAEGERLRALMPRTFFLVPGYGAQGATAEDIRGLFTGDTYGVLVNSSRGITGAWQTEKYARFGEDFGAAARQAVEDMREDIARVAR